MYNLKFLILFCLLIHISLQINVKDLFCSKKFCQSFITEEGCRKVPVECKIQNVTHNGIYLPFDGPCNCCDYCVIASGKGDKCVIGLSGRPPPTSICGDGLTCDEKTGTCVSLSTKCMMDQNKWDDKHNKGTVGHLELRPQCDRNGFYMPAMCTPGETCFCVNEEGKRIFGEVPHDSSALYSMKCGCSRMVEKAKKLFNTNDLTLKIPHCLPDGSFDNLQCFMQDKKETMCVCVENGDGYPDSETFGHIKTINKENFPCFNAKIHQKGKYLRSCEIEYKQILDEIEKNKNNNIQMFGIRFPNCQLDGKYGPVQEDNKFKRCVDPDNNVIENYVLEKFDVLAEKMNCKCARAQTTITGDEKPICCKNGNYKKLQFRRGLYRCVDSNGLQIEKENKDSNALSCRLKTGNAEEENCTADQ